jgi:hypothetical protein
MSGAAAVCTSAGSPQDRRAGAGFASGSALATDGSAAPYAAGGAASGGPGVQAASGMTGSHDLRSGGQGERAGMRPRSARVLEVPPLAV